MKKYSDCLRKKPQQFRKVAENDGQHTEQGERRRTATGCNQSGSGQQGNAVSTSVQHDPSARDPKICPG